jgi:hypothetical protein
MMDYENIKAIIEARKKQWKELKEHAEKVHADIPTISALEGSVQACGIILQDLEIHHNKELVN